MTKGLKRAHICKLSSTMSYFCHNCPKDSSVWTLKLWGAHLSLGLQSQCCCNSCQQVKAPLSDWQLSSSHLSPWLMQRDGSHWRTATESSWESGGERKFKATCSTWWDDIRCRVSSDQIKKIKLAKGWGREH